MVYNKKLVASIKCNGKVLREFNDTVYLPFGSEYSILLKNLNTVRAVVNITIDGDNIVPGGLVLYPNQEIDLERSIKNNNLDKGNRFKFIERTGSIEEYRGIKLEDGLIVISYQFEKVYTNVNWEKYPNQTYASYYDNNRSKSVFRGMVTSVPIGVNNFTVTSSIANYNQPISTTVNVSAQSVPINDAGITVPGSESNQKFSTVSSFSLESESNSIVLKLLGETSENKPVQQAITTKYKPECQTCGRKNKATAKFCSECGTSLNVM